MGTVKSKKDTRSILKTIQKKATPIDFSEYTKQKQGGISLKRKHYIVAVIEILLKITNKTKYSLCRKDGLIYIFNGQFWTNVDTADFKDFLGRVALKMSVDKYDAKFHLFKDELFKQFISDANLQQIEDKRSSILINLQNGTFEIRGGKGKLRGFKKNDFLTYQLPFDYNKQAKSPRFNKYLHTVLPEKELKQVLSEYLGYIFIKTETLKLEKTLLLYGSGSNGKSVLFEIISATIGDDNISNFSLQNLTNSNGYYRAMLINKLLNFSSEINGKLEASVFKQLSSGEPVDARLPYGNPITIRDYAKFIFNCNELPKEVENTHAFFRRFIIIPFNVTIPEKEQDKELAKKIIKSELSGVFNFILHGLNTLIERKQFSESTIIKKQLTEFEKESDSIVSFLDDEKYIKSNRENTSNKQLYNEYKHHCNLNDIETLSMQKFSKNMKAKGFKSIRSSKGVRYYIKKTV